MRKIHLFTSVALSVSLLAACESTPKLEASMAKMEDGSYFKALKDQSCNVSEATAFDMDKVLASVPEAVKISYDSAVFDANSGATVVSGMKISMADLPEAGLSIAGLTICDGSEDAFVSMLANTPRDATMKVAGRLEMTEMAIYGLEALMNPMIDASMGMAVGMIDQSIEEALLEEPKAEGASTENDLEDLLSLDNYDMSIGRNVVTDLMLHPYTVSLKEGDDADIEILHIMQKFAGWSQSVSYSDWASYDANFSFDMTQMGEQMSMSFKVPLSASHGYDRGNLKYSMMQNMAYDMSVPMSQIEEEGMSQPGKADMGQFSMSGFTEFQSIEGLNLATAIDYLTRGEMPGKEVSDLMSLGIWKSTNETHSFGDIEYATVGSSYMDLSEWRWLLPQKIDLKFEDLSYNIGGLMDYVSATEDMNLEEIKEVQWVMNALEKTGLSAPVMDLDYVMNWNDESGALDGTLMFNVDDSTRLTSKVTATVPDFGLLAQLIDQGEDVNEELSSQLSAASTLSFYDLAITDNGGIDKVLALVIELAQTAPEGQNDLAMFAAMTPEQIRNMAAGMLPMAGAELGNVLPSGQQMIQAVAAYVGTGGTLNIELAPAQPLTVESLMSIESDPTKVEEVLGLSVTHSE